MLKASTPPTSVNVSHNQLTAEMSAAPVGTDTAARPATISTEYTAAMLSLPTR